MSTEHTGKGRSNYSQSAQSKFQSDGCACSPDKNTGVPNNQERFSRLGVIAAILKDAEKRKRLALRLLLAYSNKLLDTRSAKGAPIMQSDPKTVLL